MLKWLLIVLAAFCVGNTAFAGYGIQSRMLPHVRYTAYPVSAGGGDTTAPVVSGATIYNLTWDTYDSLRTSTEDAVTVVATITDADQLNITTAMITANLTELGGGAAVNPGSYDTGTGLASWTVSRASAISLADNEYTLLTVTISAQDSTGNIGTAATDTIIGDNLGPTNNVIGITNTTFAVVNTIANGSAVTITASITDRNADYMVASDITANLNALGGSASASADSYVPATGIATWTLSTVTTTPSDGSATIFVQARDDAGNTQAAISGAIVADNTAPVIPKNWIYNVNFDTINSIANGSAVVITINLTETNMAYMDASMITADFFTIGGTLGQAANEYDSATGIATFNVSSVTMVPADGEVFVTINARDQAGNAATPQILSITADNTVPVYTSISFDNNTLATVNIIEDGHAVSIFAVITETNMDRITAVMCTADLTEFGGTAAQQAESINYGTSSAVWSIPSAVISNHGVVSYNVYGRDEAGNVFSPVNTLVTPDYVQSGLVMLIDWNNPNTTQGVANAEYIDRSGSGYNIINVFADDAFNGSVIDFTVTFDGTADWASGDIIASGSPLYVSTNFTIMTMLKQAVGAGTSSRNIVSKMNDSSAANSEWQWATGMGSIAPQNLAFNIRNAGTPGLHDYLTQVIQTNVSSNVSQYDHGGVQVLIYDFATPTATFWSDCDSSGLHDSDINQVPSALFGGAASQPISLDNTPLMIGSFNGIIGIPLRLWSGQMGPVMFYNRVLSFAEIAQNQMWLQTVTGWKNGAP